VKLALVVLTAFTAFAQTAPKSLEAYKSLKYPPLKQVVIPTPETFTLPNGMKVYLLEDHELPVISGFALVRTGNLFDPPNKRGLADTTGNVLRSGGTKSKTGDQIDEDLENIAASVESAIGEASATVSFTSLKEHNDKTLAIFRDVLTNPEFRQDKIDLTKAQFKSSISRRNDEAGDIASREYQSLLYGPDSPYGWRIEYEHINNIQRDDLVAFYKRYYFPANIMLAVYGDFKAADMKAKLEAAFKDWTVQQPPVPPFPKVTQVVPAGVYFAEKKDVTQTFFQLGHLGGTLRDKDYPALQVAADILGQGFSSRLMRRVRSQLGYAYGISASWGAGYNAPGTFTIEGSTKSKSTTEALIAVQMELEKLRTSEVTEEELNDAKQAAENSFVFFFDRPSKTLNRLMQYEYNGYPRDFLFNYQKAIAAVTRADVLRVAKQYFRPSEMAIVAVGNSSEFGKPLTDLGPTFGTPFAKVKLIDLTIPEPKAASNDSAKGSSPEAIQLLKKAQQAMGGTANLAAIRDMQMRVEIPAMSLKQFNRSIFPSVIRQEQDLPFGRVTAFTDGTSGWLMTPQGLQPMPQPVIEQARGEAFRQIVPLVLSDRDPSRVVTLVGPQSIQITAAGGAAATLEIAADGLPTNLIYETPGAPGKPSKVEAAYSDWRDVDNVKLPFRITVTQDGRKFGDLITSELKLNNGLKVDDLAKKPEAPKPVAAKPDVR
jgi:zinc protease